MAKIDWPELNGKYGEGDDHVNLYISVADLIEFADSIDPWAWFDISNGADLRNFLMDALKHECRHCVIYEQENKDSDTESIRRTKHGTADI